MCGGILPWDCYENTRMWRGSRQVSNASIYFYQLNRSLPMDSYHLSVSCAFVSDSHNLPYKYGLWFLREAASSHFRNLRGRWRTNMLRFTSSCKLLFGKNFVKLSGPSITNSNERKNPFWSTFMVRIQYSCWILNILDRPHQAKRILWKWLLLWKCHSLISRLYLCSAALG